MKTYVWMVREKTTGLWLCSKGGNLVKPEDAWIWRRADLAEKAMKKTIKGYKSIAAEDERSRYAWLTGPSISTVEQIYEEDEAEGFLHIDKCEFTVVRLELRVA